MNSTRDIDELLSRAADARRRWFLNTADGTVVDSLGNAGDFGAPWEEVDAAKAARLLTMRRNLLTRTAVECPSVVVAALPSCSVVIPNFNRWALIRRNLPGLLDSRAGDVEVIIVDDGSDPGTFDDPRVRIVVTGNQCARNGAAARNIGIRQARGDVLIQTEPEIEHYGDTLYHFRTALAGERKRIACPAAHANMREGQFKPDTADWTLTGLSIDQDASKPFESLKGTFHRAFGVWREELLSLGAYDDQLFRVWGHEDNDLWDRLMLAGFTPTVLPDVRIVHHWHPPTGSPEMPGCRSQAREARRRVSRGEVRVAADTSKPG